MPKLPKAIAKKTAEQESSSFDVLPEGPYVAKLRDVKTDGQGKAGPYWTWEFEITDGDHKGRRLWVNTSLAENALWKMKEVFDAMGYTTDSDTDEMIGEKVKLHVTQRVIDGGARKGEMGNNVERVATYDPDADGGEGGDGDEEDVF